jgi:hypothetical protein
VSVRAGKRRDRLSKQFIAENQNPWYSDFLGNARRTRLWQEWVGQENILCLGGQRNPLKTLNSDKGIQGKQSLLFCWILFFFAKFSRSLV